MWTAILSSKTRAPSRKHKNLKIPKKKKKIRRVPPYTATGVICVLFKYPNEELLRAILSLNNH